MPRVRSPAVPAIPEWRLALVCAGAAIGASASAGEPARLAQVERTGNLVCEFQKSGQARARRTPDMMLFIEQDRPLETGTARIVSSGSSGAREVRVYQGDTGVHLVESVSSSVRVTTLLSCESEAGEGDRRRCQRYAAVNTWHFDSSVRIDPDKAFRRLPGTSYHGFCEAWHMGEARVLNR